MPTRTRRRQLCRDLVGQTDPRLRASPQRVRRVPRVERRPQLRPRRQRPDDRPRRGVALAFPDAGFPSRTTPASPAPHSALEAPLASTRPHSRASTRARDAAGARAQLASRVGGGVHPFRDARARSELRGGVQRDGREQRVHRRRAVLESRNTAVSAFAVTATDAGSASGALARAWSAQVARLHSPLARLDPRARSPSSSLVRLASSPPPPPPLWDDAAASAAARSRFRRARAPGSPSGPLAFAAAIATMPPSAPAASASAISGPSRASPASTHRATRSPRRTRSLSRAATSAGSRRRPRRCAP